MLYADVRGIVRGVSEQTTADTLDDYIDEIELAPILKVTRATLQRWRREGTGPPFVRLTDHSRPLVRYSRRQVAEWLESRTVHGGTPAT